MSEKRRPPGKDHVGIYFQEQRDVEKKRELAKKQLEEKEANQCTFSPAFVSSNNPTIASKLGLDRIELKYDSNKQVETKK